VNLNTITQKIFKETKGEKKMTKRNYSELENNGELYDGEIGGVECKCTDERIDPETIPAGKYMYEVAGDDDCGDTPTRVSPHVAVNFYATVICDQPLELDADDNLWLSGNYELF
jgi:hypothetical protein